MAATISTATLIIRTKTTRSTPARTPYPATKKIPYLFHEFEGQASGRIIKDRTFFFVGWMSQIIPLGSNQIQTMPTVLERTGNFSQFATIKDPTTGNPFPNQLDSSEPHQCHRSSRC